VGDCGAEPGGAAADLIIKALTGNLWAVIIVQVVMIEALHSVIDFRSHR
jgi:hypothetical protein